MCWHLGSQCWRWADVPNSSIYWEEEEEGEEGRTITGEEPQTRFKAKSSFNILSTVVSSGNPVCKTSKTSVDWKLTKSCTVHGGSMNSLHLKHKSEDMTHLTSAAFGHISFLYRRVCSVIRELVALLSSCWFIQAENLFEKKLNHIYSHAQKQTNRETWTCQLNTNTSNCSLQMGLMSH